MNFKEQRGKLFSAYKTKEPTLSSKDKLVNRTTKKPIIYDDWEDYFNDKDRTYNLYLHLQKIMGPLTQKDSGLPADWGYFVNNYSCDKPWPSTFGFCKTDFTADGWDSCVNGTKGVKNGDGTITYDSNSAGGKVTLSKDHTFKSSITGWESGTWSCSPSGKVFLDNSKKTPSPTSVPTPTTSSCPTTTATGADVISGTLIKNCMKGDIVGEIQKHLKKHGFGNFSRSGSIDNVFGNKTEKMVSEFQSAKGLKVDGVVGPKTWVELVKDKKLTTTTSSTDNSDVEQVDADNIDDIYNL